MASSGVDNCCQLQGVEDLLCLATGLQDMRLKSAKCIDMWHVAKNTAKSPKLPASCCQSMATDMFGLQLELWNSQSSWDGSSLKARAEVVVAVQILRMLGRLTSFSPSYLAALEKANHGHKDMYWPCLAFQSSAFAIIPADLETVSRVWNWKNDMVLTLY